MQVNVIKGKISNATPEKYIQLLEITELILPTFITFTVTYTYEYTTCWFVFK